MGTHTATDTGNPIHILVVLSISADVYAHLAIGAAISTRNAHVRFHADTKAANLLEQTQIVHRECLFSPTTPLFPLENLWSS